MLQYTKTKAFRISAVIALLLALYALAGFWLAPRLLRSALMQDIPKSLDVHPNVGEIRINPFLFQLEIKDFSLSAPDGEKLLGFGRLFVDFELSSIWHRAYSFVNIDIDAPAVNAVVAPDGTLNLSKLSPKPSATKPPEDTKQPLPPLRVRSFKVGRGLVTYEDRSRPTAFAARLEPLNFELRDFTTGVEGGRFTFTAASKLGERIEWHGHVSVQPIESDGEFQIDGLRAHTIWEYLEDRLSFEVNSGDASLFATYKFSLRETLDLHADVSKITVNDLKIRPKGSDIDWITVPTLALNGAALDLASRQAHADSLTITGMKVVAWMEPDGSLNLSKLAQPPAATLASTATATLASTATASPAPISTPPTAPPAKITATPAAAAAVAGVETPWKFGLREFALRDAGISAEDRSTRPTAKAALDQLSVTINGVSFDLAKPLTVAIDTRINGSGSLSARGEVTPQPVTASLAVKLAGIDLAVAQPYIAQKTSMTLLDGKLGAEVNVRYGAAKPALRVSGNVSVAGLRTVDNALHDDFVNWERLDLKGIDFQRGPDRLSLDEVAANRLYARVIIEPDTTLNVTRVLAGPGATVIAPAPQGGTPVVATAPQAPAAKEARHAAGTGMPIAIKKIALHASRMNFADLSIQPNFATGIQGLEGTVLGLSSKPNSRAKVDIKGSVDAFSPVSILGEVNVLSAALYTDLALSFRNMELSTFNPYSGKFAGYNITKGKLTTELHYKVDGRKLDAQHHINIDQLEFGDKTDSKAAVSLPIKLAVALLKDRNGVIDLNIPVNGTLDDPQFKLGPIIWKVLVNILEKAVTAPFALLGSLFGGGPDLQFIDFRPGAAELDAQGADKIKSMIKALNGRPQLKVDVPIAVVTDLDRPALVQAQFMAQLQGAGDNRRKPGADAPDFEQLETAAKVDLLTALYAKAVGGAPKYPDSITGIKTKPELAAAKADFLTAAIREHIIVGEPELTALGQRRAAAIQQALLADTTLDPERVFLVANDKAKSQDGRVRLELSLK